MKKLKYQVTQFEFFGSARLDSSFSANHRHHLSSPEANEEAAPEKKSSTHKSSTNPENRFRGDLEPL